tara:strand:+ start:12279 stop:12767 length:489 start_codon:yes stop_codon:yes gene_type:complete
MEKKGKHLIGHSAFNAIYGPHASASEKGYPAIMDEAVYHFYTARSPPTHHLEESKAVAYTTFIEVSEGVFLVGNTWVDEDWRGEGLHEDILRSRNKWLSDAHFASNIYTLLNPQDDTKIHQLRHVVTKLGYRKKSLLKAKGIPFGVRLQIWRSGLELWGREL